MAKLKYFYFIIFTVAQVFGVRGIEDHETSFSHQLRERLMNNYHTDVPPTPHHSNVTVVQIAVSPLYIVDMEEEKSMFTLDCWIYLSWMDYRLQWNPAKYDGLPFISFADKKLWQPDVVIYNSHSSNIDPKGNTRMIAFPSGKVLWVPPATLTTKCFSSAQSRDSTYPYDMIDCQISIGSWTQHGFLLDLASKDGTKGKSGENISAKAIDFSHFSDTNPTWMLVKEESTAYRQEKYYECCKEPYIVLETNLALKRRMPSPLEAITLPLRLCAALILALFWIPGQVLKFIYATIVFVVLAILRGHLALSIRPSHIQHLAVSSVHDIMITFTVVIILEIFLSNLAHLREPEKPPECITGLLNWHPVRRAFLVLCITPQRNPKQDEDGTTLAARGTDESKSQYLERNSHHDEEWNLLATFLERIFFVIFVVVFAVQS